MKISQNVVAFSEYMNFTNYQAFLESFEARIKIYGSKLIKKLYKSILKFQDQNFDVTFSMYHIRYCAPPGFNFLPATMWKREAEAPDIKKSPILLGIFNSMKDVL